MLRMINQAFLFMACLAPDPDPGAGGDPAKELADLKTKFAAMEKENADLKAKQTTTPPPESKSLAEKAEEERKQKEAESAKTKGMEAAMRFDLGSKEWLKSNASLLPKTIEGIFATAEKEKFNSSVEKVAEIKAGIIQEFFAIQANLDLLTGPQKVMLEDFKALTKDKKQDQAQQIYDTLFEPTFETLKKVKRAEQISKGHAPQTDAAQAYLDRMKKGARKHYLGEKQ